MSYHAPSTGPAVRAVLFDVFGTVVDWRSGIAAAAGFDPAELDALARAWHFLPPWPDSVAGIAAIRRDYIVGPLSNGNTALLLDMAKAAGLAWDLILGADVSRAYKPDREAYLRPVALLGLAPGEVMLAAAHESDLAAARAAGLATAFIARPLEYGPAAPGRGGTWPGRRSPRSPGACSR